jgi:hypothetical protein
MRRQHWCWFAAGMMIGLLGAGGLRLGQAPSAAQPPTAGQPTQDKPEILQRARELRDQRAEVLSGLVDFLSAEGAREDRPTEFAEALDLLGDLHISTPAAVTAAVRNLYMCRPGPEVWPLYVPPPPEWEHPAFGAVAKIGLASIPPLIDELRTQEDRRKRQLAVLFLGWLVGRHAKSWVSDAFEREPDPAAKARLKEALEAGPIRDAVGWGAYDTHVWLLRALETGPWYRD